MRYSLSRSLQVSFVSLCLLLTLAACGRKDSVSQSPSAADLIASLSKGMQVRSSTFTPQGSIPAKFTCDGENVNPPLTITGTPGNTKSLALIVSDPDAPGGMFFHWVLWNIKPTGQIAENAVPAGAKLGKTSAGKSTYSGPCPPSGSHRYNFNVFALDTELSLAESATAIDVLQAVQGHILLQAGVVAKYQRK